MYMKPIAALAAAVVSIAFTPAVSAEPIKSQILADGSSDDNKEKRVEGQEIVINVDDSVEDAVLATKGGKVYIGNDQTQNVVINSTATSDAISAFTPNGRSGQGNLVEIKAQNSVQITSSSVGIWAQSNTQEVQAPVDAATVSITADNISINSAGSSIIAFSNSTVNLNANRIELTANEGKGTAIDVRGYSTVNIGNETSTVIINGDIGFETPGKHENSGTIIDAYVNVYLNGSDSEWNGNVYALYPKDAESDGKDNPALVSSSNLKVTLANGAQWTPRTINESDQTTGQGVQVHKKYQALNNLTLNNGIINLTENSSQVVKVEKLSGTGGTINSVVTKDEVGNLSSAKIEIGTVTKLEGDQTPTMSVSYQGVTSDELTEDNVKNLSAVTVDSTGGEESHLQTVETVKEGDLKGAWTRNNGEGAGSYTENTKLADFSSISAMSLVQWRNEINHLTKRLGDIRASESTIGAWARVYGGASEWGENSAIEMDHTTIQVGGDYRVNPNWIVGAAFSYTDSDADLVNGQAEGESYSLAAYATYMADNGSYLDMIARYGYLKNDITAGNMILDTSNNAFSVSLEGGHMFRFMEDRAYIEPQIELTYGFVAGDDATAANDVRIEQDDYQNLITRVGVRTGFDFPEKAGTIYAMLSYSYDFLGDADGTASGTTGNGYESVALRKDLGGGWVSYGIGAQFRLGDNAFAYGELERTSGGDIDNPYLFNVGFRYNF